MAHPAAGNARLLSLFGAAWLLVVPTTIAHAQSSFEITSVPRPDGAELVAERDPSKWSATYAYPASVPDTAAATDAALQAQGWKPFRMPDQDANSRLRQYKSARYGVNVHFSMSDGKPDRSRISYSYGSLPANVPFPDDATDIVYDPNRPYLRCVTGLSVEAAQAFFSKGFAEEGWSPLAAVSIEARWPGAKVSDTVDNGKRIYLAREGRDQRQPPVMLTLQRAAGDKTVVDVRVAAFALPQELPLDKEFAGFPSPQRTKSAGSTGSADSIRREAHALVIAELPVVLAFYRREMLLRGWSEQPGGAVSETSAKVTFTRPDETAVLELGQRYDLTTARLNAQVSQAAIAAREKAKKEADAKWTQDAMRQAQELIAASEAKRLKDVAAATAAPAEGLRAMPGSPAPIPLPENAADVTFDGNDGKLDFTSASSPKSIATFYRETLKPIGWKEARGVINGPTMYRMDFAKGGQKLDMTVMLFGDKAKVSVGGSGLQVPADPTKETERLEADEASGFPVPKRYTLSAPGEWTAKGSKTAFRRDFNAQVPSDIGSVLAFYRRELSKRDWKEQADGAVVKPDNVMLAFASPEGPAWLKLGRTSRETSIHIVVKNPNEAARAGVLPPAGKAKVVLGNLGDRDASVTIDNKTIKVAAGVGGGKTPDGPMLDLKPGKYRYVLNLAGKSERGDLTVAADDTWGLLIGPGGILPLQVY